MYLSLGFIVFGPGTLQVLNRTCVMFRAGKLLRHYTTTSTPILMMCPSILGPILLMSIMSVSKDVILLEGKGDMAIHRVRKDITLLRER